MLCSDGWYRDEAMALLKRFYQRENQFGARPWHGDQQDANGD